MQHIQSTIIGIINVILYNKQTPAPLKIEYLRLICRYSSRLNKRSRLRPARHTKSAVNPSLNNIELLHHIISELRKVIESARETSCKRAARSSGKRAARSEIIVGLTFRLIQVIRGEIHQRHPLEPGEIIEDLARTRKRVNLYIIPELTHAPELTRVNR